jgi:ferritin
MFKIYLIDMKNDEERVRGELNNLLDNAKSIKDVVEVPYLIDDYIEEGYNFKDFVIKYNGLVQKLSKK